MLRLHGFAVSNYFNMLQLALELKQVDYQQVTTYPNQQDEFLAISPMGKVPVLQTAQGCLSETSVILDYLEACYPEPALFPSDEFAKAKVKELLKICELYIELPARRCYPEVFFGQPVSEQSKQESKRELLKGMQALKRCAKFSPYLAGDTLSAADIVFLYSVELAAIVAHKCFAIELLTLAPGAQDLLTLLKQHPLVEKIAKERAAANEDFRKYIASLATK